MRINGGEDIRLSTQHTRRPMQQNAEATTEIRDAERNSGRVSHTFEAGIETRKNLYQRLLHCSTSMSSRTEPGYCLCCCHIAILPYCHIKENGCSPSVIAAASQCLQKEKYPHFLFRFLRDCLKTLWYRRLPDLPSPHPRRRWSFQSR